MIHPRMATMLSIILTDATVDPATLHGAAPAGRRAGPGTSSRSTATRARTTRCSSSPPGAAGAADRAGDAGARAALGERVEAVARDLARQQAADGEGATALLTCQVSRRRRRCRRSGGRPGGRRRVSLVKAAVHGRDPNWGRDRGRRGQRAARRCGGARGRRAVRRRGGGAGGAAGDASTRLGSASRSPATSSSTDAPVARCRSTRRRPARRWTRAEVADPRSTSGWRRHRRGLRLRPDRGLRQRELRVHNVTRMPRSAAGAQRE